MYREIVFAVTSIVALGMFGNAEAQWEEKVGRALFQNGMMPCPAGQGKVAFLRIDEKIPGAPMEMYIGDVKSKTESRALPGFNFLDMPMYCYAWSPDGTEFVMPQKADGCWELFRFKAGSRKGDQITKLVTFRQKVTQEQMEEMDLSEDMLLSISEIAYSPSGKRLIFSMNRTSQSAVWWFEFATSKTRQATPDLTGYYGSFFPDDDRLCYTDPVIKEGISTDEDIMIRSLTTGDIDTVCHTRKMEYSGVISPDGKYMSYVINENNVNNLHVMNLATKETRQFTFAPPGKQCIYPRWSPDGKQVFFQASGFYPKPTVFVRDFVAF